MSLAIDHLWNLTLPGRQIDPGELAKALVELAESEALDFRTKLLIRDSFRALRLHWGEERFVKWISAAPSHERMEQIANSDLGPPGFWSLEKRIMQPTRPEIVQQLLRELGHVVRRPARIAIGGSIVLILSGVLQRATEDVHVVNEIPAELREQHDLLNDIASRYDLRLRHFQSHFLPSEWESRLQSLGRYGQLDVFLIDTYDVFVSKLFSARTKDLDDLRMIAPNFDKEKVATRLRDSGKTLRGEPDLAVNAEKNWYIVYGDSLPS